MRVTLTASRRPLATSYDVALLDLDGVVYVGTDAVPGAPDALAKAREAGMRLAFVTNNAARPPGAVAEHLRSLSISADPGEVVTSSQAAAHYLADRLPSGAKVLVVGTTGLIEALRERGLEPVSSADDEPAAVVQGYSPKLDWQQLAEGAVAIRAGALWVATNLDPTVPSPRGPLPGNGSLVAALRHATGVTPVATGKPDPTMHRESVQRSHAESPIVVGDRLDTDIEGAAAVGCASLLVLSGVTSARELLAAVPEHRPDYLAPTVAGLLSAHPAVEAAGGRARCGRWVVEVDRQTLTVTALEASEGDSNDGLDPLRALCTAAWTAAGRPGEGTDWQVRATGEAAQDAVSRLELD
ncbi:MAG TPA: HAD-IIA family hydrolase [Jatrophihabitans sp.]|jgi:HAD superfamily hydrolase (TIGR01450 family)